MLRVQARLHRPEPCPDTNEPPSDGAHPNHPNTTLANTHGFAQTASAPASKKMVCDSSETLAVHMTMIARLKSPCFAS